MAEPRDHKPCRCDWFLIGIAIVTGVLMFAAIMGQILIAGPDWLDKLKPWQTAISAIVGFTGLIITTWFGFQKARQQQNENARLARESRDSQAELDRKRDADLREREARALADALLGELNAALGACRAFVSHTKSEVGKKYEKSWLEEKTTVTDLAPRIMTTVFQGNVAKLGLLGSPLVHDVVVTYENLRNYDRLARIEQVLSRGEAIRIRLERAALLERYDNKNLEGVVAILAAYSKGGYETAIPVGVREANAREERHIQLGKELGIPPDQKNHG